MTKSSTIRLPVAETTKRSFLYTLTNVGTIFNISISWFVLLVLALIGGFYYSVETQYDYYALSPAKISQFLCGFFVLNTIAMLSVELAFCRRVILREKFRPFYLSFRPREWLYILYAILIIITSCLPMFLVSAALEHYAIIKFRSLIILTVWVISTMIAFRFSLVLPAISVDNKDLRLANSWVMTKGNTSRIFLGLVIMLIPGLLGYILIFALNSALGEAANSWFMIIISTMLFAMVSFLYYCFQASYLGHIYQYFVYFSKPKPSLLSAQEQEIKEPKPTAKKSIKPKASAGKQTAAKKAPPKKTAVKRNTARKTTIKKKNNKQ